MGGIPHDFVGRSHPLVLLHQRTTAAPARQVEKTHQQSHMATQAEPRATKGQPAQPSASFAFWLVVIGRFSLIFYTRSSAAYLSSEFFVSGREFITFGLCETRCASLCHPVASVFFFGCLYDGSPSSLHLTDYMVFEPLGVSSRRVLFFLRATVPHHFLISDGFA